MQSRGMKREEDPVLSVGRDTERKLLAMHAVDGRAPVVACVLCGLWQPRRRDGRRWGGRLRVRALPASYPAHAPFFPQEIDQQIASRGLLTCTTGPAYIRLACSSCPLG